MLASPETAEKPSSTVDQALPRSRLRRWSWRLAVALLVVGCLYFFREPILRQVGGFLVVEEPAEVGSAILVFDERAVLYDEAGRMYGEGSARRVLFFRLPPRRAEVVGAVPAGHVASRRQLAHRGVPERAMEVLPAGGHRPWDKAVALRDWLGEHPDTNIVLLCDGFESRRVRATLDRVLEAPHPASLHGVADPRYDETNWWRRKEGIVDLFNAYAGLAYLWVNGNAGEVWPDVTPDEYERAVGGER